MRYLILSDIHANWEALEATLEQAAGRYDKILCCGDIVGYGADPNRVVEWSRETLAAIVRGNHDKAGAGLDDLEWFNPVAQAATYWTQAELTPANLEYLRNLPRGPLALEGFLMLHGSPMDEDEYLVNSYDAAQVRGYLESALYFFGHTHLQGGFLFAPGGVRRLARPEPPEDSLALELEPDHYYLVNPGSVGQPRDQDPRAAYLVYSPGERLVTYHRVPYDIPKAQEKIRRAGLPYLLAERLASGL